MALLSFNQRYRKDYACFTTLSSITIPQPLSGGSLVPDVAGVSALNTAAGGRGVFGTSSGGEGVHGELDAANRAGVAGIQKSTGPGVWASSQGGEGVHAESKA